MYNFVKSGPGNGNMTGKIPVWWENFGRGNRKTAGKNSGLVGNSSQGERKRLPVHETFSTATSIVQVGISLPFCISVGLYNSTYICSPYCVFCERNFII